MSTAILWAAMVILTAALPPGGTFVDDDDSVHEGSIEAIAAESITLGCNPPANDRFCPDETVTRGQMAAFLARALRLNPATASHFSDASDHLFERNIGSIAEARITFGCNPPANDLFCPDRLMTRGEMAAMLVRAFDFPDSSTNHFEDDEGHVFEDEIDILAGAEVTYGCNPPQNDRFCPDEPITRAEMASFLTRALDLTVVSPPPRLQEVVLIEPRESWGARPARPEMMSSHTVDRLTVHHAGTQTGTTGPAQIRGWQDFHLDGRGWGDIAYHLIIGIDGTVYEGRWRDYEGDTGTTYDTTGHFLVVVEGNFDIDRPTRAQLDSLVAVLAGAAQEYGVSPSTITGHRDHAATACPGTHLGSLIDSGEIENRVEALIAAGGADLLWP